jgi:hypothetical protein
MKITNRWESFETNVVNFKVQLSGGGPAIDEGTIAFGETHEVPVENFPPDSVVYKLTVTSVNEFIGQFESIKLTRLSDVTLIVTNPYQ